MSMPEIGDKVRHNRYSLPKLVAVLGISALALAKCNSSDTACTTVISGAELQETPTYATDSNNNPVAMDTRKPTDITVWDGNGLDILNPATPHYQAKLKATSSTSESFKGEVVFADGRQLRFTYDKAADELTAQCEKDF